MSLPSFSGKLILDRTFSSLKKEIQHLIGHKTSSFLLSLLLSLGGWKLNLISTLKKLPKKTLLLYSNQDLVIPLEASLYMELKKRNLLHLFSIEELFSRNGKEEEHHHLLINFFVDKNGYKIKDKILEFIFLTSTFRVPN